MKGTCLHIDDNPDTFYDEKIKTLNVGDRCIVSINATEQIGIIRYIGAFHRKPGIHLGVEFDDAVGDCDGSVLGCKYFTCEPNFGYMAHIIQASVIKIDEKEVSLCDGSVVFI